eukprot:1798969-Ditylum_brightwellii.AAC.1
MNENELLVINKQGRKAFALKHSMLESDCLLFSKLLQDCLQSSHKEKYHWLKSVRIAAHNFKVMYKGSPTQQVITYLFNPLASPLQ